MFFRRCLPAITVVLLLICALLSGCASNAMKGTPFYTGEYSVRRGPAEERVNIWPLVYYREPALSVLWPIGELTEDHAAIRPVFSVYGLDDDKQTYNVLWPIGQFDQKTGDNRIFPLFWGDDYRVVFPLYWHFDEPFGEKGGTDALFPLWAYNKNRSGYSAHVLWPIFNVRNRPNHKGWRVFPIAGHYERPKSSYSFYAWPLGHRWSRSNGDNGSTLIPLYYRSVDQVSSRFVSLLYSSGQNTYRDETWSMLVPLYYKSRGSDMSQFRTLLGGYKRDGDRLKWTVVPLLAAGSSSPDRSELSAALGLYYKKREGDLKYQHLIPLYARSKDGNSSSFISLPWSAGQSDNGKNKWQLAFPLYYKSKDPDGTRLITPLYARGNSVDRDSRWSAVVPLYYKSKSPDEKLIATLLGGWRENADGKGWLMYPLLSWGSRKDDGGDLWVAAPLFHAEWDADSSSHHLLPLYYWNGKEDKFISLAAARWTNDEGGKSLLIPPLLSMYKSEEKKKDLWVAAGLGKWSWGEKPGSSHLIPFYYRSQKSDTTLTPLFSKWKTGQGRDVHFVPPLLSAYVSGEKSKDLWCVGPLAHFSWGKEPGSSHVFPLYYRNDEEGKFLSLPYAKWRKGRKTKKAIPLLLSMYSTDGDTKEVQAAAGIFRNKWRESDDTYGKSHLLPLYVREKGRYFYTPVFGWHGGNDGFVYPFTPLAGVRTGDSAGSWVVPLYDYRRDRDTGDVRGSVLWGNYWQRGDRSGSSLFPFYDYNNWGPIDTEPADPSRHARYGTSWSYFVLGWYRNEAVWMNAGRAAGHFGAPYKKQKSGTTTVKVLEKSHGFMPLWMYDSRNRTDNSEHSADASLMLLLWDYKHMVRKDDDAEGGYSRYTRSRVLWRLWHRENSDGDISVDVFPAITYDRKKNGFKKISFFWRLFRYERSSEIKKLDLLFIPLIRKTYESEELPEKGAS